MFNETRRGTHRPWDTFCRQESSLCFATTTASVHVLRLLDELLNFVVFAGVEGVKSEIILESPTAPSLAMEARTRAGAYPRRLRLDAFKRNNEKIKCSLGFLRFRAVFFLCASRIA